MEGCQEMLANSMQCRNQPYAYINDIPFCRLHLAYKINDPEICSSKITAIDETNQTDVDEMIAFCSKKAE